MTPDLIGGNPGQPSRAAPLFPHVASLMRATDTGLRDIQSSRFFSRRNSERRLSFMMIGYAIITKGRRMTKRKGTSPDAEKLREDFHQLYGTGFDFEGETLIEVVVGAAGLLAELVGDEAATRGFVTLTRSLGYQFADDAEWVSALREQASSDAYCWPIGAKLHDLNAYAPLGAEEDADGGPIS